MVLNRHQHLCLWHRSNTVRWESAWTRDRTAVVTLASRLTGIPLGCMWKAFSLVNLILQPRYLWVTGDSCRANQRTVSSGFFCAKKCCMPSIKYKNTSLIQGPTNLVLWIFITHNSEYCLEWCFGLSMPGFIMSLLWSYLFLFHVNLWRIVQQHRQK